MQTFSIDWSPFGTMSIHAVAKQAGVSITTVSRVFNLPDRVASATRERVRDAARALRFVPNASARTLRTHESRILGVVLPTLLNPVFAECLDGIADAADRAGYSIVPLVTDYDLKREANAIDRLLARDVDGLVVTVANASRSRSLQRLRRAGASYVLAYNRHANHPCVAVDGEAAFMQAVAWLVSLGHRRIAMASGTLAASDRARERYRGFQAGMAQAGLAPGELIEMRFVQTALDRVSARLARADRPTALLCSNDLLAIRCIRAARLAGLTVPDELSVIGIDGIALGDDLTPRLSTLAQPNRLIGETCVATLVDALRSGRLPRPADGSILPFRLSEGESCAVVSASQSASRSDASIDDAAASAASRGDTSTDAASDNTAPDNTAPNNTTSNNTASNNTASNDTASNDTASRNAPSPLTISTPRARRKSLPRRGAAPKSNPPDPRMLP